MDIFEPYELPEKYVNLLVYCTIKMTKDLHQFLVVSY